MSIPGSFKQPLERHPTAERRDSTLTPVTYGSAIKAVRAWATEINTHLDAHERDQQQLASGREQRKQTVLQIREGRPYDSTTQHLGGPDKIQVALERDLSDYVANLPLREDSYLPPVGVEMHQGLRIRNDAWITKVRNYIPGASGGSYELGSPFEALEKAGHIRGSYMSPWLAIAAMYQRDKRYGRPDPELTPEDRTIILYDPNNGQGAHNELAETYPGLFLNPNPVKAFALNPKWNHLGDTWTVGQDPGMQWLITTLREALSKGAITETRDMLGRYVIQVGRENPPAIAPTTHLVRVQS